MRTRILLAALPLALLLGACHDPSGPGQTGNESRITLSYTGGVTGTFVAEGDPDRGTVPAAQTFAIGHRYLADGWFEVIAYRQRGGGRFDVATVTAPLTGVGTVAIDRLCADDVCPDVGIGLDIGPANGAVAAHTCHLDQGTIRITALSEARASGTVSGSGSCNPGGGGDPVPFQITSGSFDVAVIQH